MSFEESLILHASPTLASIKTANLYSFEFQSIEECRNTIGAFNAVMNKKGIYIELVKNTGDFYLIYVYRKTHLQRTLENEEVRTFLHNYGYSSETELEKKIDILKSRLKAKKDFPHEIGVFLGYPLDDVKAFINFRGKNCIACGDWKVYNNEEAAKCLFCKFKHCKEMYVKVYRAGRKFSDMLVSA